MNKLTNKTILGSVLNKGMIAAFAIVGALALRADHHAGDHRTGMDDGKPETFIKESAEMNLAAIKVTKLGSEKAHSEELKEFASKMEEEHKKIEEKLKEFAQDKDVTMPTSLAEKDQELYNRLENLSGEEFDTEFAKATIKGHAKGVKKLERASEKLEDEDLKEFVNNTLSEMKEHQKKARKVAQAVGLSATTIAALERETPEAVGAPGSVIIIERERGTETQPDAVPEVPPLHDQEQPQTQPLTPLP
jgi:putative membrane protein